MHVKFKEMLNMFVSAIDTAILNNIDMSDSSPAKFSDFKAKQREYFRKSVISARVTLDKSSQSLLPLAEINQDNQAAVHQILTHVRELKTSDDLKVLKSKADLLAALYLKLRIPKKEELFQKLSNVPYAIDEEVSADLAELERCFAAGCNRSAVILCGRLLEVALHRKYFEETGNDALEKNPGIGLGTLIAKLKQKGIEFDPGLTNQIHLINQIRIHCVHKKTAILNPSKQQTKAIILYTVDAIKKLFDTASK